MFDVICLLGFKPSGKFGQVLKRVFCLFVCFNQQTIIAREQVEKLDFSIMKITHGNELIMNIFHSHVNWEKSHQRLSTKRKPLLVSFVYLFVVSFDF